MQTRARRGYDRTDDLIVSLLRENARASNTELGQKLNMSESAVRRRISNLISSGRIRRFTVEVDEAGSSSAITNVSVSPAVPTGQVSDRIRKVPGVETVYETAGQFDIAVVVKGANIGAVNGSVEAIRRVEGVINTNTTMVMRVVR